MTSANDLIADAVALTTASGTLTGLDNTGATTEAGEPDSRLYSLWFKFVVTNTCPSAHFDQIGSGFDGYMLLYFHPGTSGMDVPTMAALAAPAVAYDDDSGGGGAASFTTSIPAGAYLVKWASFSGGTTLNGVFNWSGLTSIDPLCGGPYAPPAPATYFVAMSGSLPTVSKTLQVAAEPILAVPPTLVVNTAPERVELVSTGGAPVVPTRGQIWPRGNP